MLGAPSWGLAGRLDGQHRPLQFIKRSALEVFRQRRLRFQVLDDQFFGAGPDGSALHIATARERFDAVGGDGQRGEVLFAFVRHGAALERSNVP